MSFSQDVKNEILRRKITRPCCCRAAAYAAACFGKYFDERGIVLQTETEGVAHFVQRMYSRCGIAGEVVRKERPAGPVFEFHVQEPEAVRKALELFGHTGREPALRIRPDSFKCQNCVSCFVSTAFLCCGTVNDPEKGYTRYLRVVHALPAVPAAGGHFGRARVPPPSRAAQGGQHRLCQGGRPYRGSADFMGAGNAAMRIMEQRMYNDMRNKTNRLSNCETANPRQEACRRPCRCARPSKRSNRPARWTPCPPRCRTTARLRLAYPDLPLSKLGQKFDPPVSKAGLCHRFKRIQQAARRLQGKPVCGRRAGKGTPWLNHPPANSPTCTCTQSTACWTAPAASTNCSTASRSWARPPSPSPTTASCTAVCSFMTPPLPRASAPS